LKTKGPGWCNNVPKVRPLLQATVEKLQTPKTNRNIYCDILNAGALFNIASLWICTQT